jgi:hypothetical protein
MSSSSRQDEHDPRAEMRKLAQGADQICRLILDAELPDVDVDIAIENLRNEADELLPGSDELFERIYESRFRRLREQFPRGVPG